MNLNGVDMVQEGLISTRLGYLFLINFPTVSSLSGYLANETPPLISNGKQGQETTRQVGRYYGQHFLCSVNFISFRRICVIIHGVYSPSLYGELGVSMKTAWNVQLT